MLFSLNHLDLREVQRRHFLNLRVTWGLGCSSGSINTTRANEESGGAPEQKEMQEAFRANFNIYDIPEILATPCCSQIAVTKERIRSVPREQYMHHIEWILNTPLKDSISGRTWEHMWQYLFLGKAIDCPLEHKAYCRLYHICFGGREEYEEWIELQQGRQKLEKELKTIQKKQDKARKDVDTEDLSSKDNLIRKQEAEYDQLRLRHSAELKDLKAKHDDDLNNIKTVQTELEANHKHKIERERLRILDGHRKETAEEAKLEQARKAEFKVVWDNYGDVYESKLGVESTSPSMDKNGSNNSLKMEHQHEGNVGGANAVSAFAPKSSLQTSAPRTGEKRKLEAELPYRSGDGTASMNKNPSPPKKVKQNFIDLSVDSQEEPNLMPPENLKSEHFIDLSGESQMDFIPEYKRSTS